jgi:hypothetical protein
VTGSSVTANFEGFVPYGSAFTDTSHSTHGTGSITGTLQARTSIQATTQFTTDGGQAESGTLDLTYDSLYTTASSLQTISGNYTPQGSTYVVNINSDGTVFSQDPTTGCTLNGTVSIIDASYDAYRVAFTYASCTGAAAPLNGVQFTGLATLNTAVSPTQIVAGVNGQAAGVKYALVFTLSHS